jgi:hypothetical protein
MYEFKVKGGGGDNLEGWGGIREIKYVTRAQEIVITRMVVDALADRVIWPGGGAIGRVGMCLGVEWL